MSRRAALPSALALALLAACAPSGDAPGAFAEPEPAPQLLGPGPSTAPFQPPAAPEVIDGACGAISLRGGDSWEVSSERFDALRRGWHPRPEHGRPVGMRRVEAPFELPGFEFWQVQVSGTGRSIQLCATREAADPQPAEHRWFECEPAWVLVRDSTPEARPRTNEQWARLIGALDGASAVYSDEELLDRCVTGLPAAVREAVPPLRTRWLDGVMHATFVESIDVGRDVTLLVLTTAKHDAGNLDLVHEELLTIDRGVAP